MFIQSPNDSALLLLLNAAGQTPQSLNRALEIKGKKDIGIKLAALVLAHREQYGAFKSLADVLAIKGIGPYYLGRMLEALGEPMLISSLSQQTGLTSRTGYLHIKLNTGGLPLSDGSYLLHIYAGTTPVVSDAPVYSVPVLPGVNSLWIAGHALRQSGGDGVRYVMQLLMADAAKPGHYFGGFYQPISLPVIAQDMAAGSAAMGFAAFSSGEEADGASPEEEDAIIERIKKLQEAITVLHGMLEMISEALNYFPMYATLRLLLLMADLYELLSKVPLVVYEAMGDFLICRNEALLKLAVKELKQLVEVLISIAKLDIEACQDEMKKEQLKAWLKKLEEALQKFEGFTEKHKDQAIEVIIKLKEYLIKYAPDILQMLRTVFDEPLKKKIDEIARNRVKKIIGQLIKDIAQRIIEQILIKRLGEEAARKWIPVVGPLLTLIESTAIIALLKKYEHTKKALDELYIELVIELSKLIGGNFPNRVDTKTDAQSLQLSRNIFLNKKITIAAFVRCATKNPDGSFTWGKPCPVRFLKPKKHQFNFQLDDDLHRDGDKYIIPLEIDPASVTTAPCLKGATHCYTYILVTFKDAQGNTQRYLIIVGAKKF
jgi:hypothetical protein